jgi:apolipoprotein N-acyltransferase
MSHEHPNQTGRVRALLLGGTYALFVVLAFPPISMWWTAFLVPLPLFAIARDPRIRPSRAAFWAAIGSAPCWLWLHWWVKDVSVLGLIPLVIYMSAWTMLFVWLAARIVGRFGRDVLLLPLVWVGVEFFRGSVFATGYPWYLVAHSLIESPSSVLAMPASLAGVYFVSFLTASYALLMMLALRERDHKRRIRAGSAAAGLFAAWVLLGLVLIPPAELGSPVFRFATLQPNVPQDNRTDWTVRQRYRDWLTLRDLTIAAHEDETNPLPLDAIIWPEGFVPGWTLDPVSLDAERYENLAWDMTLKDPQDVPGLNVPDRIRATEVVDQLLVMQQALGVPLVVGSVAFDNLRIVEVMVDTPDGQRPSIDYKRDAMYNSAFVIEDGRVADVWYDKLHLTPFGEIMPYISMSETLEQSLLSIGAQGMEFALDPGHEPRNLRVPLSDTSRDYVSLATPICFEATISSVCRSLVARGGERRAGVMVNITNDGWFGDSHGGRRSHLQSARWRCIELATPMIRSANTGISAVIDHRGRVLDQTITPLHQDPNEGYIIGQVQLGLGLTPFAHIGDLFGWICTISTLIWGGFAIFGSRQSVQPMTEKDS